MIKFFSSWLGAALSSVGSMVLPMIIVLIVIAMPGPRWTADQYTNFVEQIVRIPVVLLASYWLWSVTRRASANKSM